MKSIVFQNKFTKEFILMKKRGKDTSKFHQIIQILESGQQIPAKYRDHKLTGCYNGSRELHIEPD